MPVFDAGSNIDYIAGVQFLRLFAPFLIVAPSGHADEDLSAALISLMDMPVIPAARLKGDIEDPHLAGGEGRQIALSGEILGKAVVGVTDGEYHAVLVCLFFIAGILCPDLLGHTEGRPCFGPSCIEGRMGQDFRDLAAGDPVLLCRHQVMLEGGIRQPLGHQRGHGDQRAVTGR